MHACVCVCLLVYVLEIKLSFNFTTVLFWVILMMNDVLLVWFPKSRQPISSLTDKVTLANFCRLTSKTPYAIFKV